MRKIIIIAFILITFAAMAKTWYVKPDGDNGQSGEDWDNALAWISEAVKNAESGDTIMLRGTFNLNDDGGVIQNEWPTNISREVTWNWRSGIVIISKSLTFEGDGTDSTIIQVQQEYSKHFSIDNRNSLSGKHNIVFRDICLRNGTGTLSGSIVACFNEEVGGIVTIENCTITDNTVKWGGPDDGSGSVIGGGAVSVYSGSLIIKNSVIANNSYIMPNTWPYGTDPYNGSGAIFFDAKCKASNYNWLINELIIENTSIIGNYSTHSNAGILAQYNSVESGFFNRIKINITNSTIAENTAESFLYRGSTALKIKIADGSDNPSTELSVMLNSCTIVNNHCIPTGLYEIPTEGTSYALRLELPSDSSFEMKNTIVSNSFDTSTEYPSGLNYRVNTMNHLLESAPGSYSRSYTISDDESIPIPTGTENINFNSTDPLLTTIRNEEGTHFYKIIAGSPAKDAIPRGDFSSYPYYNGAGIEYVNAEMDTTSLDQRGFAAWNQSKDIGAYESPYYWVDVTADREYKTIPNWKTELTIADPIEYAADTEHIWTDYMRAQEGGKIILTENSEIEKIGNSELRWNDGSIMEVEANSKIINGFVSADEVSVLDDAQLTLQGTTAVIPSTASINVGNNSKLIFDFGSRLYLQNGLNVNVSENAEIILKNNGVLSAGGVAFSYTGGTGNWLGINCEAGSSVLLDSDVISNAVYGLKAVGADINVSNSTFMNCTNGISLANCTGVGLNSNEICGYGEGFGISLTQCWYDVTGNKVENHKHGMEIVSCPKLTLIKNSFTNNTDYGLYITGYNSIPMLVNALGKIYELNNTITGNGQDKDFEAGGQIYMKYSAGVNMNNGYNNVYSVNGDIMPAVPCLRGASHLITDSKVDLPGRVYIMAENNYWGYNSFTDVNFSQFFDMWALNYHYFLDMRPWGLTAYTSEADRVESNENEPESPESNILAAAIRQDQSGNLIAAVKLYEQIIKKYPDTPESYMASAVLPYIYQETEQSVDPLLSSFDDALASDIYSNKKFFKEMKVSANLLSKKYDEAITVANELKMEAQSEDEALLAEIDISIAEAMKNKNKNNKSQEEDLTGLIAKLSGSDRKDGDPSSFNEEPLLPSETKLYQNYPNPFNPVTQIKFDLKATADVKLCVYNIMGQKISELVNGTIKAGFHTVEFNGSKFNSGIYYYTLAVDGKNITKKMVLTK
ncbi:MAG: T9SS type A sorting domain-containing protein [Candidatus Delongbacteria bacterium]